MPYPGDCTKKSERHPHEILPREPLAVDVFNVGVGYAGITACRKIFAMAEVLGVGSRRIGVLVGLGVGMGLLAGYWSNLELIYEYGIFVLDQQGGARTVARLGRYFHYLYAEAGTRAGPADWDRLGGMGFGFILACGLSWLRLFFLRFPLHPLGFVYGTGLGALLWGSALLGWAIKLLVVRYGGAGTYRQLRPFFLGMILGELVLRVVWAFCATLGEVGGGYDWW